MLYSLSASLSSPEESLEACEFSLLFIYLFCQRWILYLFDALFRFSNFFFPFLITTVYVIVIGFDGIN